MTGSNEFSWQRLIQQAHGLLRVSSNRISNAANLTALLCQELSNVSWVGFCFLDGETLMVGPFQGKPACVSIDQVQQVTIVRIALEITTKLDDRQGSCPHVLNAPVRCRFSHFKKSSQPSLALNWGSERTGVLRISPLIR